MFAISLLLPAVLVMSWAPVVLDQSGALEASLPVTYRVPIWTGNMAYMAVCPPDEQGVPQMCTTWAQAEIDVGEATEFVLPDPALGMVIVVTNPIAVDAVGLRSDTPTPLPD